MWERIVRRDISNQQEDMSHVGENSQKGAGYYNRASHRGGTHLT